MTNQQSQSGKGKALTPPPFNPTAQLKGESKSEASNQFTNPNLFSHFFGPAFAPTITETIEKAAGSDGDISELSLETNIPTISGVAIDGGIGLTVYNLDDGYRLVLKPKLGVTFGDAKGKGPAKATLLPSYGIDVKAKSIPRALELGLLVLEAEIRSYKKERAAYLLGMPLGVGGMLIDENIKSFNAWTSGTRENPLWEAAANSIFGENNMHDMMANIQPGEHANSIDQINLMGQIDQKKGIHLYGQNQKADIKGGISIGHARNRNIEYDPQSKQGKAENTEMFLLNFNLGVGIVKGDFLLRAPVSNDKKGGYSRIALSCKADGGNDESLLSAVESGLKQAIEILKSSNSSSNTLDSMEAFSNKYKEIYSQIALNMALAQGINTHVKSSDGTKQLVDKRYELVLTWDLENRTLKVALYAIYEYNNIEIQGQNVKYSRKNLILKE